MGGVDRHFPRLRSENRAADPQNVPDVVILFKRRIRFFPDVLTGNVYLDLPLIVGDMRKRRLAHNAAGHQSARDGDLFPFERVEPLPNLFGMRGDGVFGFQIGIRSLLRQFVQLFAADARLFGKLFLRVFDLFFHNLSRSVDFQNF